MIAVHRPLLPVVNGCSMADLRWSIDSHNLAPSHLSQPHASRSGEQFLESQGYAAGNYIDRGKCAGILFVYIIIYRFVAYLGVRYLKH